MFTFGFEQLIGQVVATAPVSVGDLANQWITTIVGVMVAFGSLGGVILALIQTHTHSPKLATAIADINNLKTVTSEIKQAQPQIVQGANVISQVVPSLQTAANNHETQIALLKQQLDAITAKINLLTTIVPATAATAAAVATQPSTTSIDLTKEETNQ